MRKVKQLRGWGIYILSAREESEYGFTHAVIHPDVMGSGCVSPADTDWECNSLTEAIEWIENY